MSIETVAWSIQVRQSETIVSAPVYAAARVEIPPLSLTNDLTLLHTTETL